MIQSIFESNVFDARGESPVPVNNGLMIWARDITVRNNIFIADTGGNGYIAVVIA